MIKKILYIFLLGILFIKPVNASDINGYGHPSDMMTYYYQNKDLGQALDIIQKMSDSQILEHNEHSFTPMIGFVLGIIGENEGSEEKIHQLLLSPEMKKCVHVAESLLEQYSFEVILTDPDKIQDERGLDLLWGVFAATGNPKIPETIHNFVENNKISKAPAGEKNRQDVVVMSAIWSLESNAEQHDIVKPYAEFPVQSDGKGDQNIITFYKEIRKNK